MALATSVPVSPGPLKIDLAVPGGTMIGAGAGGTSRTDVKSPAPALRRNLRGTAPVGAHAPPSFTTRMNIVFKEVAGSTAASSVKGLAWVPSAGTGRGPAWGSGYTWNAIACSFDR